MKFYLIAVAIALQCTIIYAQTYTDRYDSLELEQVLSNKRLLRSYIKCMLDKGKCTSEGRELKSHIAEALQNGCNQCTKAQREGIRTVIKHLIKYENEYWVQLVDKYDPKRVFTQKYETELSTL